VAEPTVKSVKGEKGLKSLEAGDGRLREWRRKERRRKGSLRWKRLILK